jgi:hypothetical protein
MSFPMKRRVVALSVVLLLLIGIVTGSLWLWRNRIFDEMGWTGIFLVVCFALGLLSVVGVLLRCRHEGIIVLWCRRFGKTRTQAGVRNRWMWTLISEACRGLAYPVTLQDLSVQGSQVVGRSIQTPLSLAGLILGTPLWLTFFLWIDDRIESTWLEWFVGLGGFALYIALFIGIGRLANWMTTSLATVRVDPKAIQDKLRATKRHRWARREMEVVRCTNEDWQAHVAAALDVVDLVIIDCTEATKQLSWEIELAQKRLGNENVLLFLSDGLVTSNGLQSFCLDYNSQKARDEIEVVSREWGDDDYGEGTVNLGSYGQELVAQLHTWMEGRRISLIHSKPISTS